jgi:hypothetical protein
LILNTFSGLNSNFCGPIVFNEQLWLNLKKNNNFLQDVKTQGATKKNIKYENLKIQKKSNLKTKILKLPKQNGFVLLFQEKMVNFVNI